MTEIKRLTSADLSEQLLNSLQNLLHQLVPSAPNLTLEQLRVICEKSQVFVMFGDNAQVFATATIVPIYSLEGIYGRVEDVIVDNNQQGKGYGREIMNVLIDFAKTNNISSLSLTSATHRTIAQKLYQKLGFVQLGSTDKFKLTL